MRPRTNFDVLDDKGIVMEVRGRDCFGPYTNSKSNLEKSKKHIVRYYLPRFFTAPSWGMKKLEKIDNMDKLQFSDEEIQQYIDHLHDWIPNLSVKRVEDTLFDIKKEHKDYEHYELAEDISNNEVSCVTLDVDLTNAINFKDKKIQLFLTRYLINYVGAQVLEKAFFVNKKYPELSFWDCFLMSELIECHLLHKRNYTLFAHQGMFKYFTAEDFYNEIIVKDNGYWLYEDSLYKSDYFPYSAYTPQQGNMKGKNTQENRIAIKTFIKFFNDNEEKIGSPEFLEFWKNYNWK